MERDKPQNRRGMDPSHPKTTKDPDKETVPSTEDDRPGWEDELVGGLVGSTTPEQRKKESKKPAAPGKKQSD